MDKLYLEMKAKRDRLLNQAAHLLADINGMTVKKPKQELAARVGMMDLEEAIDDLTLLVEE